MLQTNVIIEEFRSNRACKRSLPAFPFSFIVVLREKRRGFVSPCSPSAPPAPWFPGADSGGGRCRHLPAARSRSAAPIHASVELQRHKETCCWSRAQRLSFHLRKSLFFPLPTPPPAPFLFFSIWLPCKAGGSRWREVAKSKAAAKVHCEEQGKSKECGVVSSVRSVIYDERWGPTARSAKQGALLLGMNNCVSFEPSDHWHWMVLVLNWGWMF